MPSISMSARQQFLLAVEQGLKRQHEQATHRLRDLLICLNRAGNAEHAHMERDEAWRESAKGVAAHVQLMLEEDDLLEKIDTTKLELLEVSRRLGDLQDAHKVFDNAAG